MIGRIVSRYEIVERLGQGGMGVVYKARDQRLKRFVALKFLAGHLVADPQARARFEQEAQAASALEHPNIVTIYEIDEADGELFIAMSLVDGVPLRQLIARKLLSIEQATEYGVQIANGLAAAHSRGIVHRDINARNILISREGVARISDFGLAKLRDSVELTESGSILGTAAYLSPEQAWGREVDHRSDIFSFGVVLYEMLTGRLPFRGERLPALVHSILNETPPPLERDGEPLPDGLRRIVDRTLAKQPRERFQNMGEAASALEVVRSGEAGTSAIVAPPVRGRPWPVNWLVVALPVLLLALWLWWPRGDTVEPAGSVKRLVVLPFENLGGTDDEFFADAIAEEIRTQLARVSGLRIVSRTSSVRYKGTDTPLATIGKELGIDYALEGTIYWGRTADADRVRINSQLVRVRDDAQVWADAYDGNLDQIFALQREISIKVAQSLDIALLSRERQSLAIAPTGNQRAYQLYLRGNEYFSRGIRREDLRIAADMFRSALALDSDFALAHALLARTLLTGYWWLPGKNREALTEAKSAIDRALVLEPELAEGHLALGYYYYWGHRDYERALAEFQTALRDEPNNADLLAAIGLVQRRQGNFKGALDNLRAALELDPLSADRAYEVGNTLFRLRRWGEAERYLDRAITNAPDGLNAIFVRIWLPVYRDGSTVGARRALAVAAERVDPAVLGNDLALLDMLDGDYAGALGHLTILDADTAWYWVHRAQLHGLMNEPSLEAAYADSARVLLERKLTVSPRSVTYRKYLAITLAALGRDADALQQARDAVDSLPIVKDAFHGGPAAVENLALVATRVGAHDHALDQLETLLAHPAGLITIPYLELDPRYGPLRELDRFRQLEARYAGAAN